MYYLGCRWSGCVWRLSVPVKLHARNKEKERKMRKNITLHKKLNYARKEKIASYMHAHTHSCSQYIDKFNRIKFIQRSKTTTST